MSDLDPASLIGRLKQNLEPILELPDPRQRISAYHDMPYALFRYDPEDEFPLTKRYAAELTAGEGHDRFDFALRTMIDGLGGR